MLIEASGAVRTITDRVRGLQGLQLKAVFLGAASLILFAVIIADIWTDVPDRVLQAVRAIAPTLAVVATIMWIGGHNSRRAADISETLAESNHILAGTVERVTRPSAPARRTGPLKAV